MYYEYEDFFPEKLAELREQKGVSARDMSLSLGQSESYINQIENKKAFPSMRVFFYICDYLGITPQEFFDEGNSCPEQLRELVDNLKELDNESLAYVAGLADKLVSKK